MGTSSSRQQQHPSPSSVVRSSTTSQPPPSFSPSLCNTTKCGSSPADLAVSHRGRIFLTVQQIPLDYINNKKVITCQVVNIPDGDTIRCRHLPGSVAARHPTRRFAPWRHRLKHETMLVRLYGVDAPERKKFKQQGQPFAEEATRLLEDRLMNKVVFVKLLSVDQYGRVLARVLYLSVRYQDANNTSNYEQQQRRLSAPAAGVATVAQDGGSGDRGDGRSSSIAIVVPPHQSSRSSSRGGSFTKTPSNELRSEGVDLGTTDGCLSKCLASIFCFFCRRRTTTTEVTTSSSTGAPVGAVGGGSRWRLVECDVCEDLLINGYACVYRGHGGVYDDRYDKLVFLEKEAKKEKRGLWGVPGMQLPGAFKKAHAGKFGGGGSVVGGGVVGSGVAGASGNRRTC
eukprot:GHVS01014018.1.p1 GENE.GHVS01014018.1~~GHVS01014018.1.p1  ORF type:complete len:398 (+),score=107.98 GHVS01014018.1:261-1454(+)